MRPTTAAFLMIILLAVLGACGQVQPEPAAEVEPTTAAEPRATPTTEPDSPVMATPGPATEPEADAAIEAARSELGARLGVDPSDIVVVSSSEAEWPNGCLGLAEPDEMCTEALVSGWLIVLQAPGEEGLYEARTDATGRTVRFQQTSDPATELPATAVRARERLAEELNIGIEEVEVVRFTQEEWRDSCLGLGGPAESCLQVITPGWLVILEVNGKQYEAHTDRSGDSVRISSAVSRGEGAPGSAGDAAIVFEQSGGFTGETVIYRIYRAGMIEKVSGTPGREEAAETFSVDAAAVEQLLADLEDAGFFKLSEDQMPEDACCDRFNYALTVSSGTQSTTIRTVEATEGLPDAVWESIELVRTFVEMSGTLPTS